MTNPYSPDLTASEIQSAIDDATHNLRCDLPYEGQYAKIEGNIKILEGMLEQHPAQDMKVDDIKAGDLWAGKLVVEITEYKTSRRLTLMENRRTEKVSKLRGTVLSNVRR